MDMTIPLKDGNTKTLTISDDLTVDDIRDISPREANSLCWCIQHYGYIEYCDYADDTTCKWTPTQDVIDYLTEVAKDDVQDTQMNRYAIVVLAWGKRHVQQHAYNDSGLEELKKVFEQIANSEDCTRLSEHHIRTFDIYGTQQDTHLVYRYALYPDNDSKSLEVWLD